MPEAVATRVLELDRTVQETSLFIERTANRVIGLLRSDGIDPVVIKGLATAHLDHRSAHLRQLGDVDLLVGPDQLDDAEQVLTPAGYERLNRSGNGDAVKSSTMRSNEGIEVDLHRLPTRWRYGRWVLDGVVRTETVRVSSSPWRVLPRPDRFVHAVAHYILSSEDYRRLSSVADAIALWPTAAEHEEWREAIERWHAAALVGAFRTMLWMDFGLELAPIPGCDPLRGRWLGRGLTGDGTASVLANRIVKTASLPSSVAVREAARFAYPDRNWMDRSRYRNRRARFFHGVQAAASLLSPRSR